MHTTAFLSSAEAAYIAELSEQDIHRAIDEHIVSHPLIALDTLHPVSRLAAAFISFYVATEKKSHRLAEKPRWIPPLNA